MSKTNKTIVVSRNTHSFLILQKYAGEYDSIENYLIDVLNINVKKFLKDLEEDK